MKFLAFVFSSLFIFNLAYSQDKIQWMNIEEAQKANEKEPRKLIVDVYTDWCGWCKKMDAGTFSHPEIVKYINENYYAVKLNAESKEDIQFNGKTFVNQNPTGRRSSHELAVIAAVNGRLSYPTIVYIDEDLNLITQVPGYLDAKGIEPIIHFFAEEAYKETTWPDYQSTFTGSIQ